MQEVELLAPARDLETGIAAINCGADAVYLGAARFGAREAAGNDLSDIEYLARYAHKYWARVYVTVNTLLYDDEVDPAVNLIHQVYAAGADAVIIQDPGLLECDLPPIPIFASTQMHNHTPERISFLEKIGIQRVILARELSLEQIRSIREQTQIELECFIHGALCVSYSGQCYLSYALGGRSGNRGQCAQPCRRLYRLQNQYGQVLQDFRHLLSLRDLNLVDSLEDLLEAGVRSFKIEGRLKDKAYVMNVVGQYRRKLNALLARSSLRPASSGSVHLDFEPNLAKTFNRGYSNYFITGKPGVLAAWDTPKSVGEPLGKVVQLTSRSFKLAQPVELHRGDGLCFFDSNRLLCGALVHGVEDRSIFIDKTEGLSIGSEIYRNHDHAFLAALEKSQAARKIAVHFILSYQPGVLTLTAEDQDGNRARSSLDYGPNPAQKPDTAIQSIQKQLKKLGGTDFDCAELEILMPEVQFIQAAVLNNLRREVIESLETVRSANRPRLPFRPIERSHEPYPATRLSFEGNVLNQKAEQFYRRHGVEQIERAAESGMKMQGRKVMTTRYCIRRELGICPLETTQVSPPFSTKDQLILVDEQGNRFPLKFNCARCEMEVYFEGSSQ